MPTPAMSRLRFFLMVAVVASSMYALSPDPVWARDKAWENRPVAKFDPHVEFSKRVRVDVDHGFVLVEWQQGKILVRVSKSWPAEKEGGFVIPLDEQGSTEPKIVKDAQGKPICNIWLRRQSIAKSTHLGLGQVGAESNSVTTWLVITSSPVAKSEKQ